MVYFKKTTDFERACRHMIKFINPISFTISYYQNNCRFYLDEYPEQEKLRTEWFDKNDWPVNFPETDFGKLIDEILAVKYNPDWNKENTYFYNRWLRRN